MPFEPGSLTVRRVDADTWSLVDELVYEGRWQRFVVPAGFRTDFASVPRVVAWLVPRFGAYTLAAILHDWLCTEGIRAGAVTSRQADGIFRRVMRESGVPVLRRWLMWAGVRWGALADERRRAGWLFSAPGVLAVSLLAAPFVFPPGILILPSLVVYTAAERLVSRVAPMRAQELVVHTARPDDPARPRAGTCPVRSAQLVDPDQERVGADEGDDRPVRSVHDVHGFRHVRPGRC